MSYVHGDVQLTGSYQDYVILANAVAITKSGINDFALTVQGGLTEEKIRQFKNFKISLVNTHDQAATVQVYTTLRAYDNMSATVQGLIYNESNVLAAGGRLIIAPKAGGTGASSDYKELPTLSDIHSNLIVRVSFSTAPTSGSLTIGIELN